MIKVLTVTEFKYRQALADVLDDVHRKNVIKTLQNAGAEVETGDWAELEELASAFQSRLAEADLLCEVEYLSDNPTINFGGRTPLGPLFGETYTLLSSGPTPYFFNQPHQPLGQDLYKRWIKLHIQQFETYPHATAIYILRDGALVAVHFSAYMDVTRNGEEILPDAELIKRAQKKFGDSGVQIVSEGLAEQVIYALRHEKSETLNVDFYNTGRRE